MQEFEAGSTTEVVRNDANAWLARFAPLVMPPNPGETAREVTGHLQTIETLRKQVPDLRQGLRNMIGPDTVELTSTFDKAVEALDSVESDLRKRLAALSPGNPAGIVDYEALQRQLDEREARQEIGVPTAGEIPPVLEMQTSPGNLAAAGGLGVFAIGWLSFTTLHMVLMIGGMMQTIGFGAIALLGFYAIFYAAGLAMAVSAFKAGARESITLDGRRLCVTQTLFNYRRSKTYLLGPDSKAQIGVARTQNTNQYSRATAAVMLPDVNGRPISLGASLLNTQLRQIVDRINAYLAVHGGE